MPLTREVVTISIQPDGRGPYVNARELRDRLNVLVEAGYEDFALVPGESYTILAFERVTGDVREL